MTTATGLSLRDYQVDCISAILDYGWSNGRRALVALPTGTGKTVIFAHLAGQSDFEGGRMLVIAHREELLDQAAGKIREANPGLTVGIEQADRVTTGMERVVVASVQTLTASEGKRLKRLDPRTFALVVVDEAHHATADTYVQSLAHFGLAPDIIPLKREYQRERRQAAKEAADEEARNAAVKALEKKWKGRIRRAFDEFKVSSSAPLLVGVTATPTRSDGTGLQSVFDEVVFSRTIRDMMEAGWLCKVRGVRTTTATDISKVTVRGGDYAEKELSQAVNTVERNRLAVRAWEDHAKGRPTIAFCVDVQHAFDMCGTFSEAGYRADWVSGETPRDKRKAVIEAYKAGRLDVLTNCMVLTEGFDAPETACILMARPTKSSLIYTQALGRGTRLAPNKEDLIVLDLVDIAKAGVQSLNVLFGLPPKIRLDGDVLGAVKRMDDVERQVPLGMLDGAETWADVARVALEIDPLAAALADPMVRQYASMAWIKTAWGYGLGAGDIDLGIVLDQLEHARIWVKRRRERPQTVHKTEFVGDALQWAESWLLKEVPDAGKLTDIKAKWRANPPTEKQLDMARKLKIAVTPGDTKGSLSAKISAAMGRRDGLGVA